MSGVFDLWKLFCVLSFSIHLVYYLYLTFQFVVDQFQKDLETALRLSAADLERSQVNFVALSWLQRREWTIGYLLLFHSKAIVTILNSYRRLLKAETLNWQVHRLPCNFYPFKRQLHKIVWMCLTILWDWRIKG